MLHFGPHFPYPLQSMFHVSFMALNPKVPFGSQNRPLKLNDYLYGIVIFLFGRGLFLGIFIPIGIPIPLQRGIHIPLKNERNNYSLG
jgi:hypothetical protein